MIWYQFISIYSCHPYIIYSELKILSNLNYLSIKLKFNIPNVIHGNILDHLLSKIK